MAEQERAGPKSGRRGDWMAILGLIFGAVSAVGLLLFKEVRQTVGEATWTLPALLLLLGLILGITHGRLRVTRGELKGAVARERALEQAKRSDAVQAEARETELLEQHQRTEEQLTREIGILEAEVARRGERLREFRHRMLELDPAGPVVELWREVMTVHRGGDITVEREVTIRVNGPSPLHWWHFQFWGEPLTDEERRRVRPEVRLGRNGARLNQQVEWDGSNGWDVFADFPTPIEPNEGPVTVFFRYTLPHALPNLWGDGAERVRWNAERRKPIERLEYSIHIHDVPPDQQVSLQQDPSRARPQDHRGSRSLEDRGSRGKSSHRRVVRFGS